MFGVQVWYIYCNRDNKKYYYKGTENRGRRVWTPNYFDSYQFSEKKDALQFVEDHMSDIGIVSSKIV